MKESKIIAMDIPQRETGRENPKKEKQNWRPSPWNEKEIPNRDEPVPIMICKRCKHPR